MDLQQLVVNRVVWNTELRDTLDTMQDTTYVDSGVNDDNTTVETLFTVQDAYPLARTSFADMTTAEEEEEEEEDADVVVGDARQKT